MKLCGCVGQWYTVKVLQGMVIDFEVRPQRTDADISTE
jgi:hypothetical protein